MVRRPRGDIRRARSGGPRVLMIIDGSAAARRTVRYLVTRLGRPPGLRMCIVHLQPQRRNETPIEVGQAARVSAVARNGAARRPAATDTRRAARRAFSGAHAALRGARLPSRVLDTQFF